MTRAHYATDPRETPRAAPGWTLSTVIAPSTLFGANGMKVGTDGALYVAQAFGSQISALNTESGVAHTVVPVGSAVVAPDDLAFDSHGVMYITEVMSERVSARMPDGTLRVIAEGVPVANGITTHGDRIFMDEFRMDGRVLELYPDGRAPRVIAEHLTLPNALAMGPDDALYFPQVALGEIWRVAVSGGPAERVIAGLALPTAVKFSPRGELYTTEAGSGDLTRIDLTSRTRQVIAKLRPGIDNFAFAPDGRLFVSHFIDGGVAEIDAQGQARSLVAAGLVGPFGIAAGADGMLYIADGMSLAIMHPDGTQAARPALLVNHDFPGFVRGVATARAGRCFLSTSAGTVAEYEAGRETIVWATGLDQPTGLAIAPDGALVVCETGTGRVLQIDPKDGTTVLAAGLSGPVGIAVRKDGTCFVSEAAAGRVAHVANGQATAVVRGLSEPHGLALLGDDLFILDRAAKTLSCYIGKTGMHTIIAEHLPVGAAAGIVPKTLPGITDVMPGPLLPFAGLTVAGSRILVSADGAGAILAITRD